MWTSFPTALAQCCWVLPNIPKWQRRFCNRAEVVEEWFLSLPDTSQVIRIRAPLYQRKPLHSAATVRQNNVKYKNQRIRDCVVPGCLTFTWFFSIVGTLSFISLYKTAPHPTPYLHTLSQTWAPDWKLAPVNESIASSCFQKHATTKHFKISG
jgi:hypothetical protein